MSFFKEMWKLEIEKLKLGFKYWDISLSIVVFAVVLYVAITLTQKITVKKRNKK